MPLTKKFLEDLNSVYKYLTIFDSVNKNSTHFVRINGNNWTDGKYNITNVNLIKLFKFTNKNHPNSMILYFTGGKYPDTYVFGDGYEYTIEPPTYLRGRKFSLPKKYDKNNTTTDINLHLKTSLKRML